MKPLNHDGLEGLECPRPAALVLTQPDPPTTGEGGDGFYAGLGCQSSRLSSSRSLRGRLIIRNGVGGRLGLIAEIRRFCESVFTDGRVTMVYVTNDETRAFVTTAHSADARTDGLRLRHLERERHHIFDIQRTSLPIFVATGR